MRLLALVTVAALCAGMASADAQSRPRRTSTDAGPGTTTFVSRDEQGRVRTKILVQKRSYLDGGTEVMPGDIQSHQTNFIDMHQNTRSAVSNDNIVPGRPINDPFFLPGKNNPYFR